MGIRFHFVFWFTDCEFLLFHLALSDLTVLCRTLLRSIARRFNHTACLRCIRSKSIRLNSSSLMLLFPFPIVRGKRRHLAQLHIDLTAQTQELQSFRRVGIHPFFHDFDGVRDRAVIPVEFPANHAQT